MLSLLLLAGLLAGAGAAVADPAPDTETELSPTSQGFDFDDGNALSEVVFPTALEAIQGVVNPADATLVLRFATLMETAWFDAIAPYHPTAVGIYSDLGRRPASESTTNRNQNIALFYATYRTLTNQIPGAAADWRAMMTSVGLDPDDNQENLDTPVGLGNLAAKAVIEARINDGMNQLGNESGTYNQLPYADYTGYEPVNTAYELRNPSRWQPDIVVGVNGIFRVQQYATPQMALTQPYTYDDPRQFHLAPPRDSNHHRRRAYQRQADEVLAMSAALTDEQKMKAEMFHDKLRSLAVSTGITAENAGLSLEEYVQYHLTVNLASFDSAITVWYYKTRYDAVRPFSAIEYLYGDEPVTAWGGPGMGTVDDIPATEWRSYLQTSDHPEYPSGSATFCAAHAQAARRFLGTDEIQFALPAPTGSSLVEPGVTPATDLMLSWTNWTDFAQDCALSRVWGGVHFRAAVEAGAELGPQFGDLAYEFVQRHVNGQA